jgi:hypothetical protein
MLTLPRFDVASAAGSYATFGFLLVGFAFNSLFHYLTDRQEQDVPPGPPPPPGVPRLIRKRDVKVAMLYAMASLLLTSFLYLELAGEAAPSGTPAVSPPWTAAALVPYGVAFGLSVLMLFYSLTLIMLRQASPLASWSYWVVACVGPAVVLRFLLAAAAQARAVNCACLPGWPLSRWGILATVALTAGGAAVIMLTGLDWSPARELLRTPLMNRPAVPSVLVFAGVAVMTGLLSVYFTGHGSSYRVNSWVVTLSAWIAVGAVFLFALSCGCVIGPRVNVARPARGSPAKNGKSQAAGRQYIASPPVLAGKVPSGARTPGGWPPDTTLAPWTWVEPDTSVDGMAIAGPYPGSALSANHRDALIARANDAYRAGQDGHYAVARGCYQALLPDFDRLFGPEHPKTLTIRAAVAYWTGKAGDAAAARDQLAVLLPIRERVLGSGHPDTLATRRDRDAWVRQAGP